METNGQEIPVSGHDLDPGILAQLFTGELHPPPLGRFWFYFKDERWEWSPEVAALHGYPPAAMTPTTAVVLSHKHPDDYQQVAATLKAVRRDHQAFSTRHRIVDTHAQVHHVVVVAELLVDDAGVVIGTHGFYVDITPALHHHHEQRIDAAIAEIAEIAERRAGIEQAKGMLMLAYGVDAEGRIRPAALAIPTAQRQTAAVGRTDRGRLPRTGPGPGPAAPAPCRLRPSAAHRARRIATSAPVDSGAN